jgi:hypothetical protein
VSVEDAFRLRAREVRAYLRSLKSLEAMHGIPGRGFYRATATISASRAAAFIMIYNCIEFAVREGILEIRQDIGSSALAFDALQPYWREEIVRAHFAQRLSQGTNHVDFLRRVIEFIPGRLNWGGQLRDIPFPGNIDHLELIRFAQKIEYRWKVPKGAVGGADIQLVKKMRNDLAHGEETFEALGALYTTQDIVDKFDRIKIFILSFLKMLDRYRERKLYQSS